MKKKPSSYHIVMIPEDSSQIHRVRLRPWQLRCFVVLIMALTLGFAVTTGGYFRYMKLYRNTGEMRARYASLRHEQARMAQQLLALGETVERAESLAGKLNAVVLPRMTEQRDGVGPLERDSKSSPQFMEKFSDLVRLDENQFIDQLSDLSESYAYRAHSVERRVTDLYESYQNHMIRLSSTPSLWPVRGWLTSSFGIRRSPFTRRARFHEGIDIAAPWGIAVRTTGDGVVKYAGYKGGLGKTVIVDHGYGMTTTYGHNSRLKVTVGDKVKRGQVIASVGNTGHSTGPHLHYEVHVDGVPVNPLSFVPRSEIVRSPQDLSSSRL